MFAVSIFWLHLISCSSVGQNSNVAAPTGDNQQLNKTVGDVMLMIGALSWLGKDIEHFGSSALDMN